MTDLFNTFYLDNDREVENLILKNNYNLASPFGTFINQHVVRHTFSNLKYSYITIASTTIQKVIDFIYFSQISSKNTK